MEYWLELEQIEVGWWENAKHKTEIKKMNSSTVINGTSEKENQCNI